MVEAHELLEAVNAGNRTLLKELLAKLAPEEAKAWLRAALLRAAYDNRSEAVAALLDVGAETSATDDLGLTPLHWAARQGHPAIAQALLKGKANPMASTGDGTTALHLAVASNTPQVVEMLIGKKGGADPAAVTKTGCCALHLGAETGAAAAMGTLLDRQPIPSPLLLLTTDRGETPLARACARGHHPVVMLLLKSKAEPAQVNWWGQSPLQLAAMNGHAAIVQALIAAEAEVSHAATDGMTSLHSAAERNHAKVAQLLLEANARTDLCAAAGRLPLHVAAERGSLAVVEELLKANCDHAVLTIEEKTPLCLAAQRGHAPVVKALLDSKADPQALDKIRQTPLHAAAITGKAEAAELLILKGARVMQKDSSGRTPLDLALVCRQESVVRSLLKRGAELPPEYREDESWLPLVREVEREIIQEQMKEAESGNCLKAIRDAGRDFEEARMKMLRLAAESAAANCAVPLNAIDLKLQDATELVKANRHALKTTEEQLATITKQVTAKDSDIANAKKQLKAWRIDMNSMRAENTKILEEFGNLKKDIAEAQKLATKATEAEQEVYPQLADARKQGKELEASIGQVTQESEAIALELQELQAQLAKWHAEKEEATRLHAQAQALLTRSPDSPTAKA